MPESDFETELLDLLRSGRKIEAMRLYQQKTGEGLLEAKEAVERLEREGVLTEQHSPLSEAVRADVMSLLGRGATQEAVQLVRDRTGMSARAARQQVEQLATTLGIRLSERSGCLGILMLVAAACLAAAGMAIRVTGGG